MIDNMLSELGAQKTLATPYDANNHSPAARTSVRFSSAEGGGRSRADQHKDMQKSYYQSVMSTGCVGVTSVQDAY